MQNRLIKREKRAPGIYNYRIGGKKFCLHLNRFDGAWMLYNPDHAFSKTLRRFGNLRSGEGYLNGVAKSEAEKRRAI